MSRRCRGFTLIELMATVVIVGVLASAALPLAELSVKRGKEMELRHALQQIRAAIDDYHDAVAEGRIAHQPTDSEYPKRLEALTDGVPDARSDRKAKIYFLRRLPRDPFAETGLPAAQSWGLRSYESPPEMPAPGADVFDVHSRSPDIGMNGVPYREW